MGCGCGGKKFTGSGVTAARVAGLSATPAASTTVVKGTSVKLGTAPQVQPMVRKTV